MATFFPFSVVFAPSEASGYDISNPCWRATSFTSAPVSMMSASYSRAMNPATAGVAIEVPFIDARLSFSPSLKPSNHPVETWNSFSDRFAAFSAFSRPPPGAQMSGFTTSWAPNVSLADASSSGLSL